MKYKTLLALLYQLQERGLALFREERERELCLQAASLYLVSLANHVKTPLSPHPSLTQVLLGLPGSGAFKIFHPVLFSKALDCFELVAKLKLGGESETKRGRKTGGASQQSQSQSQRRRQVSGGSEEEADTLSQREAERVVRALSDLLSSLHVMLDSCSLKRSEESLETLVNHLVSLTKLETQFSQLDQTTHQRPGDVSSLAVKAYLGLTKLCTPLHGAEAGAVAGVLRALIPSILMVGEGTNKSLGVIRAHSLRFVRLLMRAGGPAVCSAVTVLVQHLAVRVPDRADFRREAAEAILTLLSALQESMLSPCVDWFTRSVSSHHWVGF